MAISLDGATGIQSPATQLVGSTSGVVTLTGAATAGTWSFTMPTTPGTAGYVLGTDGLGGTSWVPQTGGTGISVSDEGTLLTSAVTSFNFTGAGVTASAVGNAVTVSIPGGSGGGTYTRLTFTATAGQTSFTASYTVGYVQVYVNGILLNSADYTATTGTTVVLASATAAGDIVDVIALNIGTFTGNVTVSGSPSSGQIATWTSATSIQGINSFPAWQSVQTGNFTAVAGNAYPVNTTSGAVTVTLPASPTAGQIVQITDYAGTFATNNCTINPNGGKINGATTNVVLSISRESVAFVYIDATQGWITYAVSATNITSPYTASYLNVAGGGGGGGGTAYVGGGGGGAGGLLSGTTTFTPGTVYTIVIGAGGAGGATGSSWVGTSGSTSSITSLTSTVGGGGGGGSATTITSGLSGGSGGGSAGGVAGGAGTSGQGNAGGGTSGPATAYGSNGGGGAGAVGGTPTSTTGGSGGIGTTNSLITTAQATSASVGQVVSSSIYYAGGGGGGVYANTPGAGGSGGGGAGTLPNTIATAGTVNSGGGGGGTGGGGSSTNTVGGAGGSGVVLISVPTVNYSGAYTGTPTVVTNGSNTVLIFKSSGSYTA